jgi:decaprenylphospho-beta-D-erythro-pentofuranosid-2-ulose 2-reductase
MRGSTGLPQRVLIIGGSSEIGSALARIWARRGTRAFVVSERTEGRAEHLVDELTASGSEVRTVVVDAMSPDGIAPAIAEAFSEGDIDVAVIAMGLLGSQLEMEGDPARARDVLTVNATASIECALEIANHMETQRHGTIVLLGSVAGMRGRRDNYVYGASKAALDTFGEGLQQRFADHDVRVLVARPGFVFSKMSAEVQPAPFAVTLDRSAALIAAAVDRGSDVVWIPSLLGGLFYVFRLLPRSWWRAIVERTR